MEDNEHDYLIRYGRESSRYPGFVLDRYEVCANLASFFYVSRDEKHAFHVTEQRPC